MPPDAADDARFPRDMTSADERTSYEHGIAMFNAWDFFEAHETWEHAWNATSGQRHDFYQGLIQMAVTLVHLQRGNRLGVVRVFERALARWAGLPEVCLGLNRLEFERKMRVLLADVLASGAGEPVRFDPANFFQIQLEDW